MSPRRTLALTILAVCVSTIFSRHAEAEPLTPKADDEVLETIPMRPNDPETEALEALRKQADADQPQTALALELAEKYIARGKALGEPRYFGYAQAALDRVLSTDPHNAEITALRARALQLQGLEPEPVSR